MRGIVTTDGLPAAALSVVPEQPPSLETALMWAIPAFFVLWGGVAVYASWSGWKRANRIQHTPTEKARSVAMGRTEITGTVEPAGETFTEPLTDEECVFARWAVKTGGPIVTMNAAGESTAAVGGPDIGSRSVPFYVTDETGRALVEPDDGITVELHEGSRTELSVSDPANRPERVAAFMEQVYPDHDPAVAAGGPTQYRQDVIEPGDEVYVYGSAVERTDADRDEVVIRRDEEIDTFLVSDQPETKLMEGWQPQTGGGPAGLKLGAVLLAVGCVGLLFAATGVQLSMEVLMGATILTSIAAWSITLASRSV